MACSVENMLNCKQYNFSAQDTASYVDMQCIFPVLRTKGPQLCILNKL